jgi:hypothetical protein
LNAKISSQNKALQQNRDDVLRYGESIGCDLLKAAVLQQEAPSPSQSSVGVTPMVVAAVNAPRLSNGAQ